jgi:hypothetical protein
MPYQYYFFLFYYGYRSYKIEHKETYSVCHIMHEHRLLFYQNNDFRYLCPKYFATEIDFSDYEGIPYH